MSNGITEEIADLMKKNQHDELLQIESLPNDIRCTALIQKGRFAEALEIATPMTFSYFYCLYKLRKFSICSKKMRKAADLKIIDINIRPYSILLGQCLYFRGYFYSAFKIFSQYSDPTHIVNACAAASLCISSSQEDISKHKPYCKEKVTEENVNEMSNYLKNINVPQADIFDVEYNKTFAFLHNEEKYVENMSLYKHIPIIQTQICNAIGNFDEIDVKMLSNRQKEIIEHNKDNSNILQNPLLFQISNIHFEQLRRIKANKPIEVMKLKHTDSFLIATKIYTLAMYSKIDFVNCFYANCKSTPELIGLHGRKKIQKYCESSNIDLKDKNILDIFWDKEIALDQNRIKAILQEIKKS